jgi:23S rRNA-/tRNA-specific pseudouridylate synthase
MSHGLVILHEDRDIVVVDKPAGVLTVGTDRDKSAERASYFADPLGPAATPPLMVKRFASEAS